MLERVGLTDSGAEGAEGESDYDPQRCRKTERQIKMERDGDTQLKGLVKGQEGER